MYTSLFHVTFANLRNATRGDDNHDDNDDDNDCDNKKWW